MLPPLFHAAFLASSMSAAAAAAGLFLLAAEIIRAKGQNAIASRRMKRKKKSRHWVQGQGVKA
jgi:hypothetical protein